ncbi:hypothetical protein KPH14_012767, partial [Odynerus spinipes]
MPVRPRVTTTRALTSSGVTVSSPPAVSTPPPIITTTTRTTASTSTSTRISPPRKSPAKRTPPALVEQAAPLVPRKRSSGGPTISAAVRGTVSTKTPPHSNQENKATTKVGQGSGKGDSGKKKAPAAPVKPTVGRRAPAAPLATRRITRAAAAALRLQKSGGEEPSVHDISAAKEESGARITPQGPARPRRSIVTGALIRQKSSLGSTPRLRSSARIRGMPAATYAEIAAGRAMSTPITTTGGAERSMGGEVPSTPPQAATISLTTLTTATTTTTICGGSITSPGVAPTKSPGASPKMSPVPLVAPINNSVPQGRDPGPGFPPLTPSPRREKRRAEKTPATSLQEMDQGAQEIQGEQQQGPGGGAEEEGAVAGQTPSPTTTIAARTNINTITTTATIQEITQEEDWRVVGRGRKRACASPSSEINIMRSPGGQLSPSTGCGRADPTGGSFNNNPFNNNNIFFNLNRDDDGGLTNSSGVNNNNLASAAPSGAPLPAAGTSRRIRAGARSRQAANEGERANGRVNPRGSRAQLARGPTEAQLAVITALETAATDEDLEQSAAQVADGGPTISAAVRGTVSTKTPPYTTQENRATTKVGQGSGKGDSERKKAPAAPVKPTVGRRAPAAPPATRRITRAAAAALRLQKSGGEEPSVHDISTAKEESGARITPQGPARPRRSIVTGALIRQKSSLGSTPRLRSSARIRGMPAATYAEIAAGRAMSTPITTTGGAERSMGGEAPSTPPQAAAISLITLTTATTTTTICGGSITSPGVAPMRSPGASPKMSPVPLVAPTNNSVPQGRDPGPGFPPLTPSPRREKRRAEKTPATSLQEVDQGAQEIQRKQQQGPSGGAEEEGAVAGRTPSPTTTTAARTNTNTITTTATIAAIQEVTQEEDWRVVGRGRKRACASPGNEANIMRSPGGQLSPSTGCGRTDPTGGIFNNDPFNNNNIFFNLNRDDDGGLTNSSGVNNNNLASAAPSGAPFRAAGTSRCIRGGARSRRAANEGERANGRVNPRGSRAQLARGPTEAQLAVITALETAATGEDLEQSATKVAEYFMSR